jgi:hypothetical protein
VVGVPIAGDWISLGGGQQDACPHGFRFPLVSRMDNDYHPFRHRRPDMFQRSGCPIGATVVNEDDVQPVISRERFNVNLRTKAEFLVIAGDD